MLRAGLQQMTGEARPISPRWLRWLDLCHALPPLGLLSATLQVKCVPLAGVEGAESIETIANYTTLILSQVSSPPKLKRAPVEDFK